MAITECGHGHVYDSDVYAACPYCNSAQAAINFSGTPGRTAAGNGFGPSQSFGGGVSVLDPEVTAPVRGAYGNSGRVEQSVFDDVPTAPPRGYQSQSGRKVTDDLKTVGEMKKKMGIDPVVGWLVCIEGKEKGKSYELKGKVNSIGRSETMDVCIKGDSSISNLNHARLGYGSKTNRFTLLPAEGSNVIYLNGDELYTPTVLKAYDVIDFGETKLIFIPLCSERFTWSSGE